MQNSTSLRVTSSPHVRAKHSTRSIMLDVIIALIPAGVMGVWHLGWRAGLVILVSVISAVAWELIYNFFAKKKQTVGDLSAIVTGLLLAYSLPASVPMWLPVVGSGLAIILVKMIFGGIGHNFVNPALTARAILMTAWVDRMSGSAYLISQADATTGATPLVTEYDMVDMLIGKIPGCIGEISKIALLVGAAYLLIRRVISWRIPVCAILTTFVLYLITTHSICGGINSAVYQVLAGGFIMGVFFMATDYTTSPVTQWGRVIFGIGVGAMVFVIRRFSSMPGAVSYAILFMNLTVPLIDRFTKARVYGRKKA